MLFRDALVKMRECPPSSASNFNVRRFFSKSRTHLEDTQRAASVTAAAKKKKRAVVAGLLPPLSTLLLPPGMLSVEFGEIVYAGEKGGENEVRVVSLLPPPPPPRSRLTRRGNRGRNRRERETVLECFLYVPDQVCDRKFIH